MMLNLAVLAFTIVVLLGGALAIQVMRAPILPPSRALASLHGIAALIGLASLWLHRKRKRMPGVAIGIHASVAIFGYVILAVYLLAG